MESNNSIYQFDHQKTLYKALINAYESDKLILDTYGDIVTIKRCRDDQDEDEEPSVGSNRGSKKRRARKEPESTTAPKEKTSKSLGKSKVGSKSYHTSTGKSAQAVEPIYTYEDLEEPTHQEFDTGFTEDQPVDETTQHHDCNLARKEDTRDSFNELLDTPLDFSAFVMNRLKVDTLTPELLADQLDWNNPEGQQYLHDLCKPLPLIPNLQARRVIPFDHFINNDLAYLMGGMDIQEKDKIKGKSDKPKHEIRRKNTPDTPDTQASMLAILRITIGGFDVCSWCGGPFNDGNCRHCTNVSFEDEPVYDSNPNSYNQTPDISNPPSQHQTSLINQFHCFHCGDPLEDGIRCQRCTCERCGCHLSEGFCSFCKSKAGNSFVYDSNPNSFNNLPNVFTHLPQPQYETYSCELCGNDSHYGYDCPPRFPLDEFIKSSVEDLVPILSESEDTSESNSDCDLPSFDDFSPINVYEEKSVTLSNPLFDSNDDFTSSDDESLSDEDVPEDNVKIYSNPLFEFDDKYISSDVNPLFDEVLENIESKDSYVSNLDEPALLVTPLSDFNKDECFDPGGDVDEIEFLLHRDPSTPKLNIASILEGFTDDTPLEENDDLFDLESTKNEWKKILYDAPIDDLITEDKVFDPEIRKKIFSPTYVRLPYKDRHYLSLTYVIRFFLPYFTYSVDSSLPLSSESKDIIFDPGISAFQFSSLKPVAYKCPMEVCSSTCFVPNITILWGEIARIIKTLVLVVLSIVYSIFNPSHAFICESDILDLID
ncbi:hypothetical protein Tco_1499262 [Tanacetum coccineum]